MDPATALQTVPAAINASAGQAAELPVQLSNTSQTPAEARHVVPAEARHTKYIRWTSGC
jgi:hypothetical protein